MSTQTGHADGLTVRDQDGRETTLHGQHATAYLLDHGLIGKDDPDVARILNAGPPLDPIGTVTHAVGKVIPDHHHHADGTAHAGLPAHVPASRSADACPDCH